MVRLFFANLKSYFFKSISRCKVVSVAKKQFVWVLVQTVVFYLAFVFLAVSADAFSDFSACQATIPGYLAGGNFNGFVVGATICASSASQRQKLTVYSSDEVGPGLPGKLEPIRQNSSVEAEKEPYDHRDQGMSKDSEDNTLHDSLLGIVLLLVGAASGWLSAGFVNHLREK